jgi:FkbM family methyltransferase
VPYSRGYAVSRGADVDVTTSGVRARFQRALAAEREHGLPTFVARFGASYLLPKVRRPEQVVRSSTVNSRLRVDLRTSLGLSLYRYGVVDPVLRSLLPLVQPGDVVVDGGANVGVFALALAQRVGPSGRVVAFEPAQGTRALLEANVALNGCSWLDVRAEALSDAAGTAELRDEAPGSGTATMYGHAGEATVTVETTTLDAAVGDLPVDWVKLDVEGAEAKVLRGAVGVLSRSRPRIVMEVEPDLLARAGSSLGEVQEIAADLGYVLQEFPQGSVTRNVLLEPAEARR